MKQFMKPISVVVPTLNEVDNLALLFKRLDSTLSSIEMPYEIVVVDDHSTDGTAEFVRDADPKYNARLFTKQGKPGKAFSLLEGFAVAENDLICMIDADLQYPPEAIKMMYHKMQYLDADIVVTNRIDNKTAFLRRLFSYIFNLVFARALFGIKYDTQSGLKLFRRDVLRRITLSPSAWTFDLEFIVRALENGFVIANQDIPFSERNAGVPKIKMLNATLEIAGGSLKLWRNSSNRRIRFRYKYMEALQNKAGFMIGTLMAGLALFSLTPTSKASALSVPVPRLALPAVSAVSQDIHHIYYDGMTMGSSRFASTMVSKDDNQPAGTSPVQPTSAAPAAAYSSNPTDSPNKPNQQSGKNAAYYNPHKPSSSTTANLLKAARYIVITACILIASGLIVRSLANIMTRRPLRS